MLQNPRGKLTPLETGQHDVAETGNIEEILPKNKQGEL
jgi:hypothetical protein